MKSPLAAKPPKPAIDWRRRRRVGGRRADRVQVRSSRCLPVCLSGRLIGHDATRKRLRGDATDTLAEGLPRMLLAAFPLVCRYMAAAPIERLPNGRRQEPTPIGF